MGSRYVPPHLRGGSNAPADNSSSNPENDRESAKDLGLRRLADLKLSDNNKTSAHTLYEIKAHFGSSTMNATLHNSKDQPDGLSYIVLFRNANPRWKPDHIIFAHTNIHLLPGYESFKDELEASKLSAGKDPSDAGDALPQENQVDHETTETAPSIDSKLTTITPPPTSIIPVFMELKIPKGITRRFAFHGFFKVANLQFLKPRSQELVRMLQQKWAPVQRNPNRPPTQSRQRESAAWDKSMNQEWSVIRMSCVPKDSWPQEPDIAEIPDEEQENQGRAERKEQAFDKRSGQDNDNINIEGGI